jgi:hypothetical protein
MLMRTALLTAALLAASQSAIAHGGGGHRGRVIDFEPSLSIAVGSLYRDGFRIVYDLGGRRHYAPVEYAPAPYVVVPPVRQVVHVIHDDRRHARRHWRDEWREESRHHGHRGKWRSEHRWEDRHDRD